MKSGNNGSGTGARALAVSVMALALAALAWPSWGAEGIVLEMRAAARVINSAVSYHYQKTVRRQVVESACYFDPDVENSMRCSWRSGSGGADLHQMKNKVKRRVTKSCKKGGGSKCVLFWRNGTLQFDGLAPEHAERLESILSGIPDHTGEADLLPEDAGVSDGFRDWFPKARDYWEGVRKKSRGRNPHYAICSNENGMYASFYMQGRGTHISNVRNMCVLKCQALSDLYSKEGACYVVYEDGNFVNAAAERATTQ